MDRPAKRGESNARYDLELEVQRRPNAMLFKGPERCTLSAQVCCACGRTELYADPPAHSTPPICRPTPAPNVSASEELERTREALADSQTRLQELEEKLDFVQQLLHQRHVQPALLKEPAAVPDRESRRVEG